MELNAYRIMWLFVFFDLPTNTKKERKNAAAFRKNLLKDGYGMMQFSVYMRHCASSESADAHERRIKWQHRRILRVIRNLRRRRDTWRYRWMA